MHIYAFRNKKKNCMKLNGNQNVIKLINFLSFVNPIDQHILPELPVAFSIGLYENVFFTEDILYSGNDNQLFCPNSVDL